jgi:hypothetical protein
MTEPTNTAAETPELNPRAAAFKQIAQQRQEEIEPELHEANWETGEVLPRQAPQQQDDASRLDTITAAPEQGLMRLKVDGQEVEVQTDKVIEAGVRALQKESAADKRLQEASELKRRYEAMINEAINTPSEPPQQDVQEEDWVQVIKDAPFDEKAAKKLEQRLTATRIDPNEIIGPVLNVVQRKLEANSAIEQFRSKHSDIWSDPNLMAVFHAMERAKVEAGDSRPLLERWTDVAESVRQWRGPKADMQDKQERKAGIVNVPTAGGRAPAAEQPKPRTAQQIIAEQAKARHQRME